MMMITVCETNGRPTHDLNRRAMALSRGAGRSRNNQWHDERTLPRLLERIITLASLLERIIIVAHLLERIIILVCMLKRIITLLSSACWNATLSRPACRNISLPWPICWNVLLSWSVCWNASLPCSTCLNVSLTCPACWNPSLPSSDCWKAPLPSLLVGTHYYLGPFVGMHHLHVFVDGGLPGEGCGAQRTLVALGGRALSVHGPHVGF